MMWRRFTGSNGSYRGGRRLSAAEVIGRFGLAAATLLGTANAEAGQYDDYAAGGGGVVIGDFQPGQERSVMVSDGGEETPTTMVAENAGGSIAPDAPGWFDYEFGPAIINRCLGKACPRWVGQVDLLLLWQGNTPATSLLTLDADPYPTQLSANQLPKSMGAGPRASIMLNIDSCHALEANYFNAGNFSGTRQFAAPDGSQLAWNALGNYNVGNINSGSASTSGRIQSFELNWRRYNGRSLTWLGGFRWIEWNDTFAINDAYDDGVQPPGFDTLNVETTNELYGAQLGFDAVLLTLYDVVKFNGVAKAGVYGNMNASGTMSVGGDRIPPATYTASGNSTGFFGEVGVNGAVRLTDHLFWRAGYNFFWISGVATSVNQAKRLDMTVPSGTLDLGGSVFLQGVNTGIEAIW